VRVTNARITFGTPGAGLGQSAPAETISYRDAASGNEVYAHHARITGLCPDTQYVYTAAHEGAAPELGTFRTARGAAPLFGSPASATSRRRPSTHP
jgi:purple acid phosphatase-like protein